MKCNPVAKKNKKRLHRINQMNDILVCVVLNFFFHLQVVIKAAPVQAETLLHLRIHSKEWWMAVRWSPWLPRARVWPTTQTSIAPPVSPVAGTVSTATTAWTAGASIRILASRPQLPAVPEPPWTAAAPPEDKAFSRTRREEFHHCRQYGNLALTSATELPVLSTSQPTESQRTRLGYLRTPLLRSADSEAPA